MLTIRETLTLMGRLVLISLVVPALLLAAVTLFK